MAVRDKVIEGEGERFQLHWRFEGAHSHSLHVTDTKHGGGIRRLDLGGAHPRPETMEFVKEINDLNNKTRLDSAYRNFYKRMVGIALAGIEKAMKDAGGHSAIGAQLNDLLNELNEMEITDEDRK